MPIPDTVRLTAALLIAAGALPAQSNLTFVSDVDQTEQAYSFYEPRQLEPGKRYPLLLSLHARNIPPQLDMRRIFGRGMMSDPRLEITRTLPRLPDVDFFVVSPVARGSMGYDGIAEADIYQLLERIMRDHPIDRDRLYLTGADMGGAGALRLAVTRPDLWAAVALIAPESNDALDDRLANLRHIPFRLFQSERDPLVSPEVTRRLNERLRGVGVQSEYIELPGIRHAAWETAYRNLALFDWFSRHVRNRNPRDFTFSTRQYRYNRAYSITIDRLQPGQLATVKVNGAIIETQGVDALTVDLAEPQPELSIDGTRLRAKGSPVSLTRQNNRWTLRKFIPAPTEKQAGLEGPVWDAVSSAHAYVYGTHDNPALPDLESRVAQARTAAQWSTARAPVFTRFRVIADVDAVHKELGKTALVLFGDKRTNAWIARYAGRMPLELEPGAADYGLLFVTAIDGRYLLVNSGLPWWTRADQVRRPGMASVPAPWEVLRSTGDYILFKGGLDNIIAEGRFDRFWNLPPDAALKLRNVPALSVRLAPAPIQ